MYIYTYLCKIYSVIGMLSNYPIEFAEITTDVLEFQLKSPKFFVTFLLEHSSWI